MSFYSISFALGAGHSGHQIEFSIQKVKKLKNEGFFTINKTLLPLKTVYFLYMGSMVSFLPFVPVYMEQLGLSGFQIGIISAVRPLGTMLACPFWGTIADKFSIHRSVVLLGLFIGSTATGATYFTPPVANATRNSTMDRPTRPPFLWDETYVTFSVMMALSIVSIFFLAHICPMIDSAVMALLKDHPETDYGKQRLWGAVGWGSFSGITGLAMDTYIRYYPEGNRFLPAYVIFIALILPVVIPVLIMKFPSHSRPDSIAGGLAQCFKNFRIVIFFIVTTIIGVLLAVIGTFQFLFLNELKAPSVVMGLTLTFTCIAEIPFMYVSGRLITWFGHEAVFSIALVCYCLRFFLYHILQNPWLILPIELLHGICYGAFWPAATTFANKIAPQGMGATLQNLVQAFSMGLGVA
ncbi:Major facilitator superfamily domain-containing protein 6 [Holothuria leucospilota]|uniref:Major facilitator superfamily domain-containing protein 6 n=1 Tax=Holothuria leucospilota TaxID=206669 RepID=A0A9Q1H0B6_HOLLE|nr:Major facilitator superfamily domain-containing protein 6 [Holothuria leucospilota]